MLWGIALLILHPFSLAAQPLTLSLNTYAGAPLSTPEQTGYYDQILVEAFRRLGVAVTLGHLPAERSLQNADRGLDDGDFVRIAGLERLYPNLIMVPEKIDDFEFVAFTRHLRLKTTDWAALQPYHVGIVRGWKILEEKLAGVHRLTAVKDQERLFRLLQNGRVDAVVYARKEGYSLLWNLGITDGVALEPPLTVQPMHLYLNRRHAALVEPLAVVLRQMKSDGTYTGIARQTLTRFTPMEAPGAHP